MSRILSVEVGPPQDAPWKGQSVRSQNHHALRNPPKAVDEYLDSLERQGITLTVSILRQFVF